MQIINKLLRFTPFELKVRRKDMVLPEATLDSVKLALAYYLSTEQMPTLVQVGACDGVSGDPVHGFVMKGAMRAVLVEPIEESFFKLRRSYQGVPNVIPVHAAIGKTNGTVILFKVKESATSIDPYWSRQLASFSKSHLLRHGVLERDIEQVSVPCLTLRSLVANCGLKKINCLQIDTEGFDGEVVEMALGLDFLPECINFEHIHLNAAAISAVFNSLGARGYVWTHDKWNTLALHSSLIERWGTS